MRINVYAEELTDRVEIVEKEVDGKHFYGIRLYLYLPIAVGRNNHPVQPEAKQEIISGHIAGPFIHHKGDDDSAGITFWVPWTKEKGNDFEVLSKAFNEMHVKLQQARTQDRRRVKRNGRSFISLLNGVDVTTEIADGKRCPQCGGQGIEGEYLADGICTHRWHQLPPIGGKPSINSLNQSA